VKRCGKCERLLPPDRFHKNRARPDGLQSFCKPCLKEAVEKSDNRRGGRCILNRMRAYNLTREEVEAYLQIPACQICNEKFLSDSEIHFDHCHQHGHIRGVLCFTCNRLLSGTAAQCIVRNERANDYLLRSMEVRLEPARAG
jgi:hypothetical protein